MTQMPALCLSAVPGRRQRTIELAQEIERRGFAGIYCASFGDAMGLCLSMAHFTSTIPFGTAIAPIYTRHPFDMAQQAAYIHEIAEGRFRLGLGVSHAPQNSRLGVQTGKPLSDMRAYIEAMRQVPRIGELPPIVLATLRKRMVDLSVELGDGAVWANAARSHLGASLAHIPAERLDEGFFVGNMLNVCVDDDVDAAREVMRRQLNGYLMLPNYRNYWREAGYNEEMDTIETEIEGGQRENLAALIPERWLRDVAVYGSASDVRDQVEEWFAAGMRTPVLVPSSARGGQVVAYNEVFAAFE